MTTTYITEPEQSLNREIILTLLQFGIPTLIVYISFWYVRPVLENWGLTQYEALVVTITVPMALLLVASLVGFHFEQRNTPDLSFRERFRLPEFELKFLVRGIVVFVIGTILYGLFFVINELVMQTFSLTVPENATPVFANNSDTFDIGNLHEFFGGPIQGEYGIFVLYVIMLFFNIVGEEFWWRGYIQPRQEKSFGSFTWIIHGLFWNIFHVFKWWQLIALLSVTLLIPYVAQKYKEIWSAIISHSLFNGLFIFILFGEIFL